jgi:hypothetical protein
MEYKVIAATTNPDANGDRFEPSALQQMAEQSPGKNITVDFNPIIEPVGKAIKGDYHDGLLAVEIEVEEPKTDFCLVPAFKVKREHWSNGSRIIDEVELMDYGVTVYPADHTLTKAEKIL